MPTPGLSLVGFIADQQQAHNHLLHACVPANNAPAALTAEWNAAQARRGAMIPFAGHPDIRPLPAPLQAHAAQVLAQPVFQAEWRGARIEWAEIGPLLAHQMTVDSNRSMHHCGALSNPPTPDELMVCCLPLVPQPEQLQVFPAQNSLLLKARSLNVRIVQGIGQANFLGIQFDVSIPHVHVAKLNGRSYLFNGYHRAVGLMLAGATYMPCIVRDVADHNAIGIRPPDTFSAALLDSADPPTLAHFAQGRAHHVSLRIHSRILYVNWAEHAVPDE
jgi:hypothetical protein